MEADRVGPDGTGGSKPPLGGRIHPEQALAVVLLLLGLAITGLGVYSYVEESTAVADAVEIEAEITDTQIREVSALRGNTRYEPTATFEYRFRGTTYTSDDIFPAGSSERYRDRAAAESVLSAFEVGETVTAYVAPDTPSEAYLRATRSNTSRQFLVFGVFMALVGGVRLLQTWVAPKFGSGRPDG
jgi:hypothetical protein